MSQPSHSIPSKHDVLFNEDIEHDDHITHNFEQYEFTKTQSPLPLNGVRRRTAPLSADIGGTMTKIVFWIPGDTDIDLPKYVEPEESVMSGFDLYPDPVLKVTMNSKGENELCFMKFPTLQIPEFIHYAKTSKLKEIYGIGNLQILNVTGGGAYKFANLLKDEMDLEVRQQDEMRCLVLGVNFLLLCCQEKLCFRFVNKTKLYREVTPEIFPYLLVNVGSGVSILKVTAPEKYERVSGSLIGGGTFWGLCCLLTNYKSFDEMLQAAQYGQHQNVDLYVKDIYGRCYDSVGLAADMMASSFGKVQKVPCGEAKNHYSEADIAQGLMMMVCGSIAHLGFELTKLHHINRIFYTGGFVAHNPVVWEAITTMLTTWSSGSVDANFLEYDGYFGSIGALLLSEYEEELM
ncbi:pantothenate kinase 1, putative [Entamoeba nuttalli P19]|uniref:pantothenate kinase n=1 Tax=Entamoeba nuttalli (strain P19) TaxID=1076696 RepID=K2HFU6_ENTNP|nr:pantothenate kinase 1, putative [Entamoeba nuttalli P19]EKE41679.1 pantothenate kinase 1, putative [Entamoeba nuttalli P19]|eukprot:XP_008855986.1 pantothenate kinase 1, putative [Entamoeba nuttalli P19]